MHELGIIFMHHNLSNVTLDHFDRVKAQNPGCPVIGLSGGIQKLPGGFALCELDCYKQRWQKATKNGNPTLAWGNPDLGICQWYSQNTVKCQRWAVMEWDTKCCMPWKEFWDPVWNAPAAGIKVFRTYDKDKWHWFKLTEALPKHLQTHATGIYLFGCLLLSDRALRRVTEALDQNYFDGFSELRLGTLLSFTWNEPVDHPNPRGIITHDSNHVLGHDTNRPGIWHPVKNLPVKWQTKDGEVMVEGLKVEIKTFTGPKPVVPSLTE